MALEGLKALRCITMGDDAAKDDCLAAGAAGAIVGVLRAHPRQVNLVHEGCWALANLTSQGRRASQDACVAAGAAQTAVWALNAHGGTRRVAHVVCWTLSNLAENPCTRSQMVACGAVRALVAFLSTTYEWANAYGTSVPVTPETRKKANEALRRLGYAKENP